MAKFKKGDRVRDTEAMRDGVIVEVDAEKPGYYAVKYDTRPQPQWNVPESYLTLANSAPIRSANSVVQNAINARRARNAMGLEQAEQRAGQFVAAAKSRISSEAGTLADSIKLLKQVRGHEGSKKIQDALVTLQWALSDVEKAAAKF